MHSSVLAADISSVNKEVGVQQFRVACTMCSTNSKAIVHCRISSGVATCFRSTLPLSRALQSHPLAVSSVVHPSPSQVDAQILICRAQPG